MPIHLFSPELALSKKPILKRVRGFTLIELLVVIAIVAVISVVVIIVLNPSELMRQARDSNRMADMTTIRKAIGFYMADVKAPALGTPTDFGGTAWCFVSTSTGQAALAGCGGIFSSAYNASTSHSTSTARNVDGTGWVPVALSQISSKSPLAILPVDPVNNGTYYYAYAATSTSGGLYELTAIFESAKYIPLEAKDSGASSTVFEVGTILTL